MSDEATPLTQQGAETDDTPPFDPDPALVGDVENNRFAIRSSRKAAEEAHEQAVRDRQGIA